jgi:hypothetical protein
LNDPSLRNFKLQIPNKWRDSAFYETILFEIWGIVLSSAILLGFADSTKMVGKQVGWVEERNPTKNIGMLNPTYE